MELILYIIIAWFVVACFITALPKEDLVINKVLYFLLVIITVNISTVISLNMELIVMTQDVLKFGAVVYAGILYY